MKILNAIDSWLEDQERRKADGYRKDPVTGEWYKKVKDSHHPSGFSKCMRELYYSWTDEPVTDYRTATDVWRMNVGKWIEAGLADILKKMYGEDAVEEQVEVDFHPPELKYRVHGYRDFVLKVNDIYGESHRAGLELKTSFGRGIVSIQQSGVPKEQDEAQAKIYVALTNDMDSFSLPYLGRDSFYRTEFDIQLSDEGREKWRQKIIEKFQKLEQYVEKKVLPPRDYHAVVKDCEIKREIQHQSVKYKSDWQCLYCLWRSRCWASEISSGRIYIKGVTE